MPATLADLAAHFGCEYRGDPDVVVNSVATLAHAGPDSVAFLANPLYRSQLVETGAAVVVLEEKFAADCPVSSLLSANPYATYARVARFLHPLIPPVPGVDETASISASAIVSKTAQVSAHAVVGAGSELGDSVFVGPGCVIGAGVRIGSESRLIARVTVLDRVVIGERCVLHPGAVIGSDGFGFARDRDSWLKVPQLGSVVVGNDVDIGANTTIDRGTIEDTVIEDGVILDNLIQIAHNVRVGEHTAMAALCGIAGSVVIGKRCMLGGAVVLVGHISLCDDVMVTFHSSVMRSIKTPGTYSSGLPAEEASRWRRNAARVRKLDDLARRQTILERQLEQLTRAEKGNEDD
jgi:UDP-3-O-[3-hydroxymyristoyl] glucosamine N-acyltransferase